MFYVKINKKTLIVWGGVYLPKFTQTAPRPRDYNKLFTKD